jgi:VCBS repeat-containing protein
MSTTTVNSAAALTTALKLAHAGDTILVEPGTYSNVVISNVNFSTPVTIESAQSSKLAIFAGLGVANSSGLNFTNLELTSVGSKDAYFAFRVASSHNISFSDLSVHGDLSATPSTQLSGFYVSASTNISISDSSFSYLNAAITENGDSSVKINNNNFSYLNKGGIEMGGTSDVDIANNSFTNFHVSAGTHADAIQFYTAGTTTSASNISITGNEITRGSGDAIQGIFIQDETGNLPYQNINITDNSVIGGLWNSIYVHTNVTGLLSVENNLVESYAGVDRADAPALSTTFQTANFLGDIDLLGNFAGASVVEQGNTAQGYLVGTGTSVAAPAGNILVGAVAAPTEPVDLTAPLVAKAVSADVSEHNAVSGNILAGDTGNSLYVSAIGIGTSGQKAVPTAGSTYTGAYGVLTIQQDGAYSYNETKDGLTVGQTYIDHFTTTIASASGGAQTTSINITVTGSGEGNGAADLINCGAGSETVSGFGAGTRIASGTGADKYIFNSVGQSTPSSQTIINDFKAGDIIDLSAVDPNFHLVAKFDGHPNELVISKIGVGNWEIYGDTTGAGKADFQIHVTNVTPTFILGVSSIHI